MHTEQWNQLICVPPAVSTSKIEVTSLPQGTEYLQKIRQKLEKAVEHLKSPAGSELFKTELYLTRRFYYKGACIYRRFRIRRTLRQLRNCLTRLMDLNVRKSLEEFLGVWPRSTVGEKDVYLPRKEMLQFLLVRLMGGARLLMQTCAYCHHGFEEVMFNLRLGMLAPQMLVLQACLARVWALCHSLRKQFEEWFDVFAELGHHVPEAETEWLQVEVPNKLSDWLPPDPDLPRDELKNLQNAAEKSDAMSLSAAKIMIKDWNEDESWLESEPAKPDASQFNDSTEELTDKKCLVQETVANDDDLGSPVSRKETRKPHGVDTQNKGTMLFCGHDGDDLGSPVLRRETQKLPDEDSEMENNGTAQKKEEDSKKRRLKLKMKKKRKEKLLKKLLSSKQLDLAEPETSDDGHLNPNGSDLVQPPLSEKKKSRKKEKTKKRITHEIDIPMKREVVNFKQLENASPFISAKKIKKRKFTEYDITDSNHNAVVSKRLKKNKTSKKVKSGVGNTDTNSDILKDTHPSSGLVVAHDKIGLKKTKLKKKKKFFMSS